MRKYIKATPQNCSGCRLCELVCSDKHRPGWVNPKESRIRVLTEPRENKNLPRVCIQCDRHPCIEACPAEAIEVHETLQAPIVDPERCTGCKMCVDACQYGFMFFDDEKNVAIKCDLCMGEPECIKTCKVNAIALVEEIG